MENIRNLVNGLKDVLDSFKQLGSHARECIEIYDELKYLLCSECTIIESSIALKNLPSWLEKIEVEIKYLILHQLESKIQNIFDVENTSPDAIAKNSSDIKRILLDHQRISIEDDLGFILHKMIKNVIEESYRYRRFENMHDFCVSLISD